MMSVRGLYCMFIKMTSVPPSCSVSTPRSSAALKMSGSILRMALKVPVCHITKSGFSLISNFPMPWARSCGLAGPDQRHNLDRDQGAGRAPPRAGPAGGGATVRADQDRGAGSDHRNGQPPVLVHGRLDALQLMVSEQQIARNLQACGSAAKPVPASDDTATTAAISVLMPRLPRGRRPASFSDAIRDFVLLSSCTMLSG